MIIGPELSRHIQEFEKCSQKLGPRASTRHHEQNTSTKKEFEKM